MRNISLMTKKISQLLKKLKKIEKQISKYLATTPLYPGLNPSAMEPKEEKKYELLVKRKREILRELQEIEEELK